MKTFTSLFLILILASIALFGFAFLGHSMSDMKPDCAFPLSGTICPNDTIEMAVHHISTLQTFSNVVIPPIWNLILFFASLILAIFSTFLLYKFLAYFEFEFLRERLRDLKLNFFYSRQKIVSWLSLFELSPTF